jgi:hypothetical protein
MEFDGNNDNIAGAAFSLEAAARFASRLRQA